jgi:predicted PurR-regulated permease PerM
MDILGRILRTVALAILFGGSAAVVFSAVTLVREAVAEGLPRAEAAARNAPIFIHYAKVNLIAGVVLLIGEALDYAKRRLWNKSTIAQYTVSLLCVVTTMIFALALVPPMERALPHMKESEQARQEFHELHKVSQMVFGGTILLALASLVLPIFGALKETGKPETDRQSA